MNGQQKLVLKKGYGSDYNGAGFLYSSEMNSFEMADRALGKRIKEVDDLFIYV